MALTQTFQQINLFLKRRYLAIIVVFVLLILSVEGAKHVYLDYVERHWEITQHEEELSLARSLASKFEIYQREAFDAASSVARLHALEFSFSLGGDSLNIHCFEILSNAKRQDMTFAIFDQRKRLISWGGVTGVDIDTSQLLTTPHSLVSQGPLYSYLIVSVPVEATNRDHRIVGYVVVERLFDVNYPISNRFINKSIFAAAFTSQLEVSSRFDFSLRATPRQTDQTFSVELRDVKGSTAGFALLSRPQRSARTDEIRLQAYRLEGMLVFVTMCIILFYISTLVSLSGIPNILFYTSAIWILRYVMLWFDVPSAYIHADVFDPSYFASSFGWGLAKSVGDLFVTAAFLLLNVILMVRFLGYSQQGDTIRQGHSIWKKLLAVLGIIFLGFFCCVMLRGFSATIHSAVFDSSLRYNDPTFIIPPPVLSVMLLGIFLISCSLIVVSIVVFNTGRRLAALLFDFSRSNYPGWIIAGVLFCGASVLFGIVYPNPLLKQSERLLYIVGIILATLLCRDVAFGRVQFKKLKSFATVVAASIAVMIPQLDNEVHYIDRSHAELIAGEIVRPADSWLTFVLNRSLDEVASPEVENILRNGDRDDVQKLAFTSWAKSILSQQGYNCSVLFVDFEGKEVSDFHLGVHETAVQHRVEHSLFDRYVKVETRQSSGGVVKWYVGYAPLYDEDGELLGGVRVEISADKRALLRGEAQEMLKNYTEENFDTHNRSLLLSEYIGAKMVFTTGETIPLGRDLPNEVQQLSPDISGIWLEETVSGISYETYFTREQSDVPNPLSTKWIGLSMERLDIRWHLFTMNRLILFYLLFAFGIGTMMSSIQKMRGKSIAIDFRTKLLFAFVIVSFIPIATLAYYNRRYAVERAEELMIKQLSDETKLVVSALQEQHGLNMPISMRRFTNAACEDIANSLGTDFNVYDNGMLLASSKPEVYFAELLPTRLSSDAYFNVALKTQMFYYERQSIGTLPYIVGHRPMFSQTGAVIGTVSVPSLYRQREIDEDIVRRNAFLFGAYAVAALISVLLGTVFANQISSPLRRLQQATQKVAEGDLSVTLHSRRSDEFGELERAFEQMTVDLQRAQEEMVRVQRELAWKEMAQQVAHEIKNPLTPMKLSIQHLRQAYKDKVDDFGGLLHRISETLLEQVEALSRIASEFSRFARLPQRNIQPCNLHDILQEAKNLFQHYPRLTFDLKLNAENATVNGDKEELQRVFINVIRNAVQAMNESGSIVLRTNNSEDTIEIQVSDTGPGISEDVRDKLFQPNFSTKSDGMGIGLNIVKQTVDALGGSILIESEAGKGTIVIIRLPVLSNQ